MRELGGYGFDDIGIADLRTKTVFQRWGDLEAVTIGTDEKRQYHLWFYFTRIREVKVVIKRNFWDTIPLRDLAEVLALATRHAPSSADISLRAAAIAALANWSAAETEAVARTSPGDWDSAALVRAAQWSWLGLKFWKARRLAKAAAGRDPLSAAARRVQLEVDIDRRVDGKKVLRRCVDVLALDGKDPVALPVRALILLGLDKPGVEGEALNALEVAGPSVRREIVDGLAAYYARQGRYEEASQLQHAELARQVSSNGRHEVEVRIQFFDRLRHDPKFRRELKQKQRRENVFAVLVVVAIVAGFALRVWARYDRAQERERVIASGSAAQAEARAISERGLRTRFEAAKRRADAGDTKGMLALAKMYRMGLGVAESDASAREWELRAAEHGDVDAIMRVATSLDAGDVAPKDLAAACRWYERAAEAGNADAMLRLGDIAFRGLVEPADYVGALKWYRLAADKGNGGAQGHLGWMYEKGIGVTRDYEMAIKLYRSAADGDPSGWPESRLGIIYTDGIGAPRDAQESFLWFQRSAKKGNSTGQCMLGVAYQLGLGIDRNQAEAIRWYTKSADKGDPDGLYFLAAAYDSGRGVAKDVKRSHELLQQAVDAGHPLAELWLANMYATGAGWPKDEGKARELAQHVANKGVPAGLAYIAKLDLIKSAMSGPDFCAAREIFKKVAEKRDPAAMTCYGILLADGLGGPADRKSAENLFRDAAELGIPAAMVFLAELSAATEEGEDGRVVREKALAWLETNAATAKWKAEMLAEIKSEGMLSLLPDSPAPGSADEENAETEADVSAMVDRRPAAKSQARPIYPPHMRYLEIPGEVVVDFIVDTKGHVQKAYPVRSTSKVFEAAAVASVSRWRFAPGIKGGKTVNTHMQVPIVFSLNQ